MAFHASSRYHIRPPYTDIYLQPDIWIGHQQVLARIHRPCSPSQFLCYTSTSNLLLFVVSLDYTISLISWPCASYAGHQNNHLSWFCRFCDSVNKYRFVPQQTCASGWTRICGQFNSGDVVFVPAALMHELKITLVIHNVLRELGSGRLWVGDVQPMFVSSRDQPAYAPQFCCNVSWIQLSSSLLKVSGSSNWTQCPPWNSTTLRPPVAYFFICGTA